MTHNEHNIELPPEFNAAAQLMMYTRYGDPRVPGWENKWICNWHIQDHFPWFPEKTIQIHKHFKPVLQQALDHLVLHGLEDEIRAFDGCYKVRNKKGHNSVISMHAWGAAIDLNAAENPHGSIGRWSPEFINVMVNNGISCGQNWEGRKDPMHFAMVNG